MPIKGYGVWRGTPTAWDPQQKPDHGHITFTDGSGGTFDSAVNVMSQSADTRLVYWLDRDFDRDHPVATRLAELGSGFQDLRGQGSGAALDFLRGRIVDVEAGVILSHDGSGNDIVDYLSPILEQAVEAQADMWLLGQQYYPGRDGIHDVHMNQGSVDTVNPKTGKMTHFRGDNGTWQDGGIILSFPDGHWEAIFLAFASQASVTDNRGQPDGPLFSQVLPVGQGPPPPAEKAGEGTGEGTEGEAPPAPPAHVPVPVPAPAPARGISIEAALVNPIGPDEHPTRGPGETVFLLNQSEDTVTLAGWIIANGAGQEQALSEDISITGLSKIAVPVPRVPLSNKGGKIVLRDTGGEVVSSVTYSKEQAEREGKLIYFHGRRRR